MLRNSIPFTIMRYGNFLSLGPHGFHRIAYTDWGDPASRHAVICAHGLTRNGRDFDFLAAALAPDCRVVCPDMAGRGKSEWLAHKEDYDYPLYLTDMAALLARIAAAAETTSPAATPAVRMDWIGSSMGGLIGMLLAAQPNSPITRLVLNDIGPFIPKAAMARIAENTGHNPRFGSLDQVEMFLRAVAAPFGPLTDTQWRHLALHGSQRLDDGSYALLYDPGIAENFNAVRTRDLDLWEIWDRIACPVLVIRGTDSDLLPQQTAHDMLARGPSCQLAEFSGIGHAPMLMAEDQIKAVRDFLLPQAGEARARQT